MHRSNYRNALPMRCALRRCEHATRRPTAPPPSAVALHGVALHGALHRYAEELGERLAEAAKVVLEKPLLGEHALGDDAHEGKGTVRLAKVDGSPIR